MFKAGRCGAIIKNKINKIKPQKDWSNIILHFSVGRLSKMENKTPKQAGLTPIKWMSFGSTMDERRVGSINNNNEGKKASQPTLAVVRKGTGSRAANTSGNSVR